MLEGDPGLEWLEFYNSDGPANTKTVCHLPRRYRLVLGSHTSVVKIRRDYVRKGIQKHGFSFDDMALIEKTILNGEAFLDSRKQLNFFLPEYADQQTSLFVAIKTAEKGAELWVKSYHRKRIAEKNRLLKRLSKV
ncbi:MAG: hypothetical protein AAGI09_05495 [Pseudomonadota bacterium]